MNEEQRLDSLLKAMPLEPLPTGLTTRIMAQIRPAPTFIPFRLQFSDILLALACTIFIVVGIFFAVVPLLQDVQHAISFVQINSVVNASNLTLPFVVLLELLIGCAIYLSVLEE